MVDVNVLNMTVQYVVILPDGLGEIAPICSDPIRSYAQHSFIAIGPLYVEESWCRSRG